MFKLGYLNLLIGLVIGFSEANTIVKQEEFVGLCSSGKCQNGATCVQLGKNLAICLCRSNFLGIFCDVPITTTRPTTVTPLTLCTQGICQNDGFCSQINENLAICVCKEGFSGVYCEQRSPITTASITESPADGSSSSTPPEGSIQLCPDHLEICNNGICTFEPTSSIGIITCFCKPGFKGQFCDEKI